LNYHTKTALLTPLKRKIGVRTKYDRMFERKNQGVLSEHYKKLVDHSADLEDNSDDDFITLKRADHELPGMGDSNISTPLPESESVSKRKLKMGQSKRAMLKYKSQPTKLIFDEDGNARQAYEIASGEDFLSKGKESVRTAGEEHAKAERKRLAEADVIDREQAKERRREKKRKRKEREHVVSITCFYQPIISCSSPNLLRCMKAMRTTISPPAQP
jgi:ATP-dependent RNA helicase DDX10/DBP4